MGIIVKYAGRSIWEPSLDEGFVFVAQVRSLEEILHTESGVGFKIADEVDINLTVFENFLSVWLGRLERSMSGELFALTAGCLQICIALNWKMGGKLPLVSPKFKPLLEGANFFGRRNWRFAVIAPSGE